MRPAARLAIAAATTLAMSVPLTGAAVADPDTPVPSQQQVDRAKKAVEAKSRSVEQIEGALAAAQAQMQEASTAAQVAAEKYNGAMWRLAEASKASEQARVMEAQARENVENQRRGIVSLVTDSYQNGTELNTATALMSDEGPKGLMNRYAVVQSAGDSMEATYDRFRAASVVALEYAEKAAKAEKQQKSLAAEARKLAEAAGQAATAAGAAANQIAAQKLELVQALAEAQNISLELATKRHKALEQIAREKAAAAARAKQEAEQAALKKAAVEAAKKAKKAKADRPEVDDNRPDTEGGGLAAPVPAPPVVINPAPNQAVAVQRAISYAKAQLGKPYQWAAIGPNTFDCSGLTMQAWARGGKSLPHYSVAQFYQSTRVSMLDAKPGDLLFWSNNGTPSGIHHVALYIGGGQFIEAPYTGSWVRYNSISNWYPDFVARP